MKVKMVKYNIRSEEQIFATFEYQRVQFDCFREKNMAGKWDFIKDRAYETLEKIMDTSKLLKSCEPSLKYLDTMVN